MIRAARGLWTAALLILIPARALAEVRLVLASDPSATLTRRLNAEASEIGLVLVQAPLQTEETPRRVAERERAVGVLHVVSSGTVELWVSLPNGGSGSFESVRGRTESDEAFALRIVEETRARFVELHVPDADTLTDPAKETTPPGSEPNVTPTSAETKSPSRDEASRADARPRDGYSSESARLGVSGGAGVTFAAGGMGATVDALLGLHFSPGARFRIAAEALLPLTNVDASGSEGTATARAYFFAADVVYVPWPAESSSSFWGGIGAGVGGVLLVLEGHASPGYVGTKDTLGAAVPFLNAVIAKNLTASLSVEATLLAGFSVPRPTVRFDGRDVAAWGRPVIAAMLALDWSLPLLPGGTESRK